MKCYSMFSQKLYMTYDDKLVTYQQLICYFVWDSLLDEDTYI